ncbi:MAG: 6-carboxytetrahydropterin synthase [Anaerolineales bacterium]|nr:6-carboxytetrahydropterin synthase [Anaerolineales bacterium]MDW8278317.1 6-carboxytetrahydropterin synthase [Anaerolineales bacterium]
MYTLAVKRDFIARHALIGGNWGPENLPNSHHYVLELHLSGNSLDQYGYLADIIQIERLLEETIARYRERMLNDLPEFEGLNPSLEHFARILAHTFNERIDAQNLLTLKVVLWEHESAWASYEIARPSDAS